MRCSEQRLAAGRGLALLARVSIPVLVNEVLGAFGAGDFDHGAHAAQVDDVGRVISN